VVIVGCTVTIIPIGLRRITQLGRRIGNIIAVLKTNGVNWDNFTEEGRIPDLAYAVVAEIPDLLSDLTGIHEEDISRLPLEDAIRLIETVVEVNISDLGAFEKKAKSLVDAVSRMIDRFLPDDEPEKTEETVEQ
jgi:hypothetical protein